MSKKIKEMAVKYKSLLNESDVGCKSESSLDKIFASGCYSVEIEHADADAGLPIEDCDSGHYIVGSLVVTDCGTVGPRQRNRITGQVLMFTNCTDRATKIYTRTFADGEWSIWRSLVADGAFRNISSTSELLATVEYLNNEVGAFKESMNGSFEEYVGRLVNGYWQEKAAAQCNPLSLSNTAGFEDIIALVLGDGQAHELGVRLVVKSSGRVAFADLTLGINFYFDYGVADSSPTGIREYWCKVARDGKYYIYYARINWDIINEVAFSTDTPAETFIVSPYPRAHSVAGSNLLDMLQRLDYDIAEVTKYNSDGIAEVLSVIWRDGTPGTATYSDYRADVLEYTTLTVTYNSYVKVVQAREYNDTGDLTKKTTILKNA